MRQFRSLLVALAVAAAGSSEAVPLPLGGLAPGARLAPGTRVVTEWQVPVPGTEAELVLSLDAGRTFPLRITRETEPGSRTLAFCVPNLPAAHVLVALRTGGQGYDETIRALSAEFAIVADPSSPAEPLVPVADGLATRDAAHGAPLAPLPFGLDAPAPVLSSLGEPFDVTTGGALAPVLPSSAPTGSLRDAWCAKPARPSGFHSAVSNPKRE